MSVVAFAIFAFAPNIVFAENARNVREKAIRIAELKRTMAKFANLPEYCMVRLSEREYVSVRTVPVPVELLPHVKKWSGIVGGRNWKSFHHYCWGLDRFNNGKMMFALGEKKANERKVMLELALREFGFVENRIDPKTFPFYEQMLYYVFQIHMDLGQWGLAARAQAKIKAIENQKQSKSKGIR